METPSIGELLAAGDHVGLQRLLLEEPALVREEVPGTGRRPLSVVCSSPDLDPASPRAGDLVTCTEVLLAAGADPNETYPAGEGEVPVLRAAARNPDAARLLLEAGAHATS